VFEEVAFTANLAEPSLMSLTFGVFFFDFNLDGYQDVFAANGHIDDVIQTKEAVFKLRTASTAVKGPRGVPGGIFLMPAGKGRLSVRMWFPLGCDGHEGVLDEVFQLYHAHRAEMGIVCILGLRTDDDRRKAREMGWLGTSDRVILNGKTSFPVVDKNGQNRSVKLVGFEGKDYSVADFRKIIRGLLNQPNGRNSATPTRSSSDPAAPGSGPGSR